MYLAFIIEVVKRIHINCDLGEGNTDLDREMMPLIDACNIACGGHFGDDDSIYQTIELAQQHQVEIGAHPSYPDKQNFGRVSLDLLWTDLSKALNEQWNLFKTIAKKQDAQVSHIKPHGALYNDCQRDDHLRGLVFMLFESWDEKIHIYTNARLKETKLRIKQELFLDRNYNDDQSLVSRTYDNALISDPNQVIENLDRLIFHQELLSITGTVLRPQFHTLCVHSDSPNALKILESIQRYCESKKIARV